MADQNSMQANLGLTPGVGPSGQMMTPSPAQTAMALSRQALDALVASNQQMQSSMQLMYANPSISAMAQQVQNQIANIQASPAYIGMGEAQQSPLSVMPTGQQTGRFVHPQGVQGPSPLPPMPQMPFIRTPFTPQMPAPMFQSAWEQEMQNRQSRADQLSSIGMQLPSMAGQGAAYGGAALMGSRMLGRFGPIGSMLGAAGGAAAAHFSGVAQGMGNMAAMPFQPMREAHEMGAAIQRTSQNWAIGGPNLSNTGPGFNRGASIELAQGVQQMASDSGFQKQTGNMFNQQDLMQIMNRAGQAGLMDQSQDIQSVRRNLRQTAQTIKEFMELTNDPDVSNVIRTMGQLRDVGMDQMQMRGAAASLKMYSRSAGLSMGAMGAAGMSGAQAFGAAGLAPDVGYAYGMQATAAARQTVASGTFGPRQLAMMGGVGGIANRELQGQAAFLGTPAFSMAVSQFTPNQGWQMDPEALQGLQTGDLGAKALMKRAKGQMQRGFDQGGVESLAMWPLQQRMVAAQAAEALTPEETNLMRFRMAEGTGREMGLTTTQGAFALGARRLFGEDQATQMIQQAANPEYWEMRRQGLRQRRQEIEYEQYTRSQEERPGLFGKVLEAGGEAIGAGRISSGYRQARRGVGNVAGAIGGFFGGIGDAYSDWKREGQGITTERRRKEETLQTPEQRQMRQRNTRQMFDVMQSSRFNIGRGMRGGGELGDVAGGTMWDVMKAGGMLGDAEKARDAGMMYAGAVGSVGTLGLGLAAAGAAMLADMGFEALTGVSVLDALTEAGETVTGNLMEMQMDGSEKRALFKRVEGEQRRLSNIYKASTQKVTDISAGEIGQAAGISGGDLEVIVSNASKNLRDVLSKKPGLTGKDALVTEADLRDSLKKSFILKYGDAEGNRKFAQVEKSGKLDRALSWMTQKVEKTGSDTEVGVLKKAQQANQNLLARISGEMGATSSAAMGAAISEEGGRIWGKKGYSNLEETIGGIARGTSEIEFAGMVAIEQGREEELLQIYKERGGGSDAGYVRFKENVEDRLSALKKGEKGGDIADALKGAKGSLKDVMAMGAMLGQWQPFQKDIERAFSDFGVGDALGKVNLFDPKSLAGAVSQKDRERLKAGGGRGAEFAELMGDVEAIEGYRKSGKWSEKDYQEAMKGPKGIMGRIAALGERGEITTTTPGATGAEADKIRKSEDAVRQAQEKFTKALVDFAPASETFKTAANAFNDAVTKADKTGYGKKPGGWS